MKVFLSLFFGAAAFLSGDIGFAVAAPKVAKFSPCEKLYNQLSRRVEKRGETHYAVATTGGRGLSASNTGCGFNDGFDTKAIMMKSALQQCRIAQKRGGYPGPCKVIEAK
jgi:hypothetical protein